MVSEGAFGGILGLMGLNFLSYPFLSFAGV